MSSSRLTFSAMLSTVQTTANTVTATLEAANQAVGMLTAYVGEASANQKLRQVADREVFLENLITEKSEERALSRLKVEKFIAQSAKHHQHYEEAYETFSKLLRPADQTTVSAPQA